MEEKDNHGGGGGFNDRVDKIFGSISKSSSSSSSSLWSLSDAQIERIVWNKSSNGGGKRDDDQTPLSSSFDNNEQDWDIRSSIGLDSTLDNEEEEDEYDKIAQGTDNHHHGPYLNSHHLLLDKLPAAAAKQHTFNVEQPPPSPPITIKSILKRKTHHLPKPPKRVRFDPTCKPHPQVSQQNNRSVPDYILNPSNYTRYDFHHNDRSNGDVYLGLLEQLKKKKPLVTLSDHKSSSAVLPKSVVFIPRKKRGDAACNSVKQQQSTAIRIAALEVQQQQGSEMQQEQESHVCTKPSFQTPGRQYRSKMEEDDTVC